MGYTKNFWGLVGSIHWAINSHLELLPDFPWPGCSSGFAYVCTRICLSWGKGTLTVLSESATVWPEIR